MADLADLLTPGGSTVAKVFNVLKYGAVGDSNGTTGNGTDNVTAFQAAITAAQVLSGLGGAVIWVPHGVFRLATATLSITASNIRVEGLGTLFFDSTDTTSFGRLIFDGGASSGTISNVSCSGIKIINRAGVQCNANSPAFEGYEGQASGVAFRGCKNFRATNLDISQVPNYCISLIRSTDGVISRNYLHDSTADGVHAQTGCKRIQIVLNNMSELGDDMVGIGFEGAENEDILIAYNTGTGCGASGIAVYGPTNGCDISHNVINSTYNAGIKAVALYDAGSHSAGASTIKGLKIENNTLKNCGMRDPADFSRGYGVACGIWIQPDAGTIEDVSIANNTIKDCRNIFINFEAPSGAGSIGSATIIGNICDGIAATGGQGSTTSGSTGNSLDTADTTHPGITLPSATNGIVLGNTVVGAVGTAIINGASSAVTDHNIGVNGGGGGGGAGTLIASDDFNRADVSPTAGGLGNTSVGAKTWVGDPGGIDTNKARTLASSFQVCLIDAGVADVDVRCTITIPSGGDCRLRARCTSTPSDGIGLYLDSVGQVYYYDGNVRTVGTFSALSAGTYVFRLVVVGNVATGYIDGVQVATGSPGVTMATTDHYVGFSEGSGSAGNTRFDDFEVYTA